MTDPLPDISIIVTIVDSGAALDRCLNALRAQAGAPAMEVIIPYDPTVADMALHEAAYPEFTFLALGPLRDGPPKDAFEEHELFDKRRAGGLKIARAPLIAMIEDRGWPKPDWARQMVNAHKRHKDGVIGGAVESGAKGLVRWAIFFIDFGRYQAPFDSETPEYVTDTNICYKRAALEAAADLWQVKYQESEVNWRCAEKGFGLRLTPEPVVVQERDIEVGLWTLAMERVHWARTYGQVRARGIPFSGRLKWILATPLLPIVLYIRHLRRQMRIGRHVGAYVASTPIIILLLVFWSIGECVGLFEASGPADEKPADKIAAKS